MLLVTGVMVVALLSATFTPSMSKVLALAS